MSKNSEPVVLSNEDGTKTLKLCEPIPQGSESIDSMTFQKPKAKHLKHMKLDKMEMADFLVLGGKISGNPPSVMDELGMADMFAMVEVISDFLPHMEVSGKTV